MAADDHGDDALLPPDDEDAEEPLQLVPAGPDADFEGWLDPDEDEESDPEIHETSDSDEASEDEERGDAGGGDAERAANGDDAASGLGETVADFEEVAGTVEIEQVRQQDDTDDPDHVDTGEFDFDVTEEAEVVGIVHELTPWDNDEADDDEEDIGDEIGDLGFGSIDDLSEDDYLAQDSTTRDHAGLAAAIAAAEDETTEQVALSASIPGIESGVVGFEDVVAAEGQYAGTAGAPRASDLAVRIGSAVLLIAVFLASLLYRPALVVLAAVVFLVAAGEFYTLLMQRGHRPLSVFGFVGLAAAAAGTVIWGVIAIPVALAWTSLLILLFFAVVPGRVRPLLGYSLTIGVMAWVGLGIFAFPIIASDAYRTLVLGVVAAVAIMDIVSYFVGRILGRNQLAPVLSPKKTWEGLVGGVVAVLIVGAVLHYFPPFDLTSGLLLGVIVAVIAPLGDLAVSAVKRALDVKDMGAILPGHGGLVDRIDALLFVIPAAWALFTFLELL